MISFERRRSKRKEIFEGLNDKRTPHGEVISQILFKYEKLVLNNIFRLQWTSGASEIDFLCRQSMSDQLASIHPSAASQYVPRCLSTVVLTCILHRCSLALVH